MISGKSADQETTLGAKNKNYKNCYFCTLTKQHTQKQHLLSKTKITKNVNSCLLPNLVQQKRTIRTNSKNYKFCNFCYSNKLSLQSVLMK